MQSSQTYPQYTTANVNLCSDRLSRHSDEESSSVSGIPWGVSLRKFTVESKQLKAGFPPLLNRYLGKIFFFN